MLDINVLQWISPSKVLLFAFILQNVFVCVLPSDSCQYCVQHGGACRKISGVFVVSGLSRGSYNPLLELPPRACSINITEIAPSNNYIALKSDRSERILNNYWILSPPGRYPAAGTVFEYFHGGAHPSCPGQCIFAAGPTSESVTVQLLYYSENPGIQYEFVLPKSVPFQHFEGTFAHTDNEPSSTRRIKNHRRNKSPSKFEGERSLLPFSSRTEGSLLIRSRNQLRSSLTPSRNVSNPYTNTSRHQSETKSLQRRHQQELISSRNRHRSELTSSASRRQPEPHSAPNGSVVQSGSNRRQVSSSNPDVILRRYGYDDLHGRGLSYSQTERSNARRRGKGRRVPVVRQTPRYVPPPSVGGNFTSHEASSLQGPRAALAGRRSYYRGRQTTNLRARQTGEGRHNATTRARQSRLTRLNSVTDDVNSIARRRRPVDRGGRGQYEWKISGFTKCSVTCGGGFQETLIVCVLKKARTQVTVTDENCDRRTKPEKQQVKCKSIPCPADWVVSPWSECSVTCGSGTQTRRITCKQRLSRTLHLGVSASTCDGSTKPAVSQMCERDLCARWDLSDWGQCSVKCGIGERKRKVKCVDHLKKHIPNKYCPRPVPAAVEKCDMGSCHTQWWVTAWSHQCPVDCGSGVQTRSVVCASTRGEKLSDSLCERSRKPDTQVTCQTRKPCDTGSWFTGPWSKCSSGCGTGVQQREVVCVQSTSAGLTILPDTDCVAEDKPTTSGSCQNDACGAQWYMTSWTECSVTCGSGIRQRQVKCLDQLQQPAQGCDVGEKPAKQEVCHKRDCRSRSWPQATSTRFLHQASGVKVPLNQGRKRVTISAALATSGSCKDKYRNCRVVVQARLCSYHYYKKICCHSCLSEH